MPTERFDVLTLTIGATAILGSLALSFSSGVPEVIEILAQLMLLLVLIAAVKGGRRWGTLAALAASAVYVVGRIDTLTNGPLSPLALLVLASRFAAYGLVGIVGGEIAARMRYTLAGLHGAQAIDDWSRVYNQAHAASSLEKGIGRYTRYAESFSVLLVGVSQSVFAEVSPSRQRKIVRAMADHLRSDVRLVDEVARLDDGRFAVFLPHTPKNGAEVVRTRIMNDLPHLLGAAPETVNVKVLGAPEDFDALNALADALAPKSDSEAPAHSA